MGFILEYKLNLLIIQSEILGQNFANQVNKI
jgi:hypothetical protein